MKVYIIFPSLLSYFILISYINSALENSISSSTQIAINEIQVDDIVSYFEPILFLINPNKKYYYICFPDNIIVYDYIDKLIVKTISLPFDERFLWVTYGIDKDYSFCMILCELFDNQKYIFFIKDDTLNLNKTFEETITDVFSIGNGENDWIFVRISTNNIYFHNFNNLDNNDFTSYLAFFNPNYNDIVKMQCTYYNFEAYCIGLKSESFKLYIIPIDKISDSKEITLSDMTYCSDVISGTFIKLYTFLYSKPLITYESDNDIFISNFYGAKIQIENELATQNFAFGEINKNLYYFCGISYPVSIIICNIIPYSQNLITANSVDLEKDIYRYNTQDTRLLWSNENTNGIIMTVLDIDDNYFLIRILDPTIDTTHFKISDQNFSGGNITKTINSYKLDIYDSYYLYINDINGIIYLNNEIINKNNYYPINGNDQLTFYIEENVEIYLKFTLNFGKGVINYETFTYENSIAKTIDDIISDINEYISNDNTNKEYSTYEIYYYSGSTFIEKISKNNNLSKGEFSNSFISSIKTINNINENSNIRIIKVDVKVGDYPTPSVFFLIIDENENIVTMPSVNIVIEKPIANYSYMNIDRAFKLNEKSINIYNSSDPFFNDICFTFVSENNGKDVPLKDRRNEYYVNITFCESNCEFSYFDYVNVKVVCNCHPLSQISGFEELSFSNLKNSFITHLIAFNYKIIKCYKSVFNTGNYDNMGTILIFISIVVCIICTILYIKYHNIEPVKIALEKFQPKTKFNEERIDSIEKMKKTDDIEEINNNNENKNVNNKENNQMNEKGNKDKSVNSINTYSKETLKKDLSSQEIENKRKKIEELKYDLGQLSFEEALIFDNRTIKQKYWDYLLQSQLILSHFYADLILELRYIKIIILMINFSLQFFFNCFFYTDEYISDVYHRNAVISFFSDLPKVIYSILVSFIINTLLKALSYYKDDLITIVFEENDFDIYWEKSKKILNNFYYRLNLFIIIVFILQLFFLYYCTAFCAIYPNNQKVLLFSIFQDFLINALLPFVLCFIIAYFKHLSIQKKNKKLFIVVGFLDYLL